MHAFPQGVLIVLAVNVFESGIHQGVSIIAFRLLRGPQIQGRINQGLHQLFVFRGEAPALLLGGDEQAAVEGVGDSASVLPSYQKLMAGSMS